MGVEANLLNASYPVDHTQHLAPRNLVSLAFLALLALGPLAITVQAAEQVGRLTYGDLVARMTDLRALAVPPVAGEESGCVSSYDRSSHYDPQTGRYVNWRANADGTGSVRKAKDGIVAAELQGPGVVWRIWSAAPGDGAARFYVDGAESPAFDCPFNKLFDSQQGPFPFDQLVREMARGQNCFIPIPFNKSLRIELAEGWGMYYQITYSTFPDGWTVPSFTGSLDQQQRDHLAVANRAWANRGQSVHAPAARRIERRITLNAGESVDAASVSGKGAITGLRVTLDESEPDRQARLLREVAVAMFWDRDQQPSVWSPLGDFFGSTPGVHPFRSLVSGMREDELWSRWYMPFADGARIQLTNNGSTKRTLKVSVTLEESTEPAEDLLRFHAKWHRNDYQQVGADRLSSDRYPDWPVLSVDDTSGRFCGMHLHAWNPLHKWDKPLASRYEQPTSELCDDDDWFQREVVGNRYWYGEGDEKFFVDREPFPSTFGTGTEDYFGFAWGTPQRFDSATQAQTVVTNNTGHISLVRYHVADNVPFQKSFEACIEKYHGDNWPLLYSATAYWYQSPHTSDRYRKVPVAERIGYDRQPTPRKLNAPEDGLYEGERHLVPSAGAARVQDVTFAGPHWSGAAHLLLEGPVGEEFALRLLVEERFEGSITLQLTQAPDYGVCDITIDDHALAQNVDCYAEHVQPAQPIMLKRITLEPGEHRLQLKLTGANQHAKTFGLQHYLLGVDFLRLEAARDQ